MRQRRSAHAESRPVGGGVQRFMALGSMPNGRGQVCGTAVFSVQRGRRCGQVFLGFDSMNSYRAEMLIGALCCFAASAGAYVIGSREHGAMGTLIYAGFGGALLALWLVFRNRGEIR